jgi:hypothetical protein
MTVPGQVFGLLTALRPYAGRRWLFECECGVRVPRYPDQIRGGCGYCNGVGADFAGEEFGDLTAVRPAPEGPRNVKRWWFRCICGREAIKTKYNVISGSTKTCGACTPGERLAGRNKREQEPELL